MATNHAVVRYYSAGSQKENALYVYGDVDGKLCKAVFQVKNNTLSYVEAESDDCMNDLGVGAWLSKFKNVRVSHEEKPPKDADQSYRNAKWYAAWEQASKQCPASR